MVKKLNIGLYPGELVLIQVKGLKDMPDKYKPTNFNIFGYSALCCVRTKKSGFNQYILAFEKDIKIHQIAHESLHAVNMIFERLDINYDKQNDEHACYLLAHIVDKCLKYIKVNGNGSIK